MSIYDEMMNFHKKKKDDDLDLPSSFFMKSPLYNGTVYLNNDNLSYLDSDKNIRIKEKTEKKLLQKIKKYGYVG